MQVHKILDWSYMISHRSWRLLCRFLALMLVLSGFAQPVEAFYEGFFDGFMRRWQEFDKGLWKVFLGSKP